jgi:glycosyltransferase involved in cell wall biosynthesis
MHKNLVSIIIPLFNRGNLIGQTLESLINQTYTHWECLVIDDGSSDNSFTIATKCAQRDNRIKVFKRDVKPKGAPTCRQIGMEKASGDLVIFLDSDDLLAPWALETRAAYFSSNSSIDVLISNGIQFNSIKKRFLGYSTKYNSENILGLFLQMEVVFQTTSPTWKKTFLEKNNIHWDQDLPCWQDVDFAIRAFSIIPNYIWSDECPDYFLRKDDDPNALTSFSNIVPKVLSNFYTYEKWVMNEENRPILEKYFPDYMLSKLEFLLSSTELQRMIDNHSDIIKKHLGGRAMRYLRLYNKTRNIKFIRGLVYRLRSVLSNIQRQTTVPGNSFNDDLKKELISKLKENNSELLNGIIKYEI